jgi:hypothetical protein
MWISFITLNGDIGKLEGSRQRVFGILLKRKQFRMFFAAVGNQFARAAHDYTLAA